MGVVTALPYGSYFLPSWRGGWRPHRRDHRIFTVNRLNPAQRHGRRHRAGVVGATLSILVVGVAFFAGLTSAFMPSAFWPGSSWIGSETKTIAAAVIFCASYLA